MIPSDVRILVCTEPQDMRRSFDGLSLVVEQYVGAETSVDVVQLVARLDEVERAQAQLQDDFAKASRERDQYRVLYQQMLERCRKLLR